VGYGAGKTKAVQYGLGSIASLGKLMASMYTTCILFVAIVLGAIARMSGFGLWKFLKYIRDETFTVLGILLRMFEAAIAAAQPSRCVRGHLPPAPKGRLVVIGAGKASGAMVREVEGHWSGPIEGLVVTRHGYAVSCNHIEIVEWPTQVAGLGVAKNMEQAIVHLKKARSATTLSR